MNTHDHDNDALPGDDELKALYRALPRKEPSPALDSAVKRAAAEAVRPVRRGSATRWPVAVASAAMVVVAAGIGWRVLQQPSSVPQIQASRSVAMTPSVAAAATTPPAAPTMDAAPAPIAPPVAQAPASMAMEQTAKRETIRTAVKAKVVAPVVPTEQAPVSVAEASSMASVNEEATAVVTPPAPAPSPIEPLNAAQANAPILAGRPRSEGIANYRANAVMKAMPAPAPAPAPSPAVATDDTSSNPADTPALELDKIRRLIALQRRDEAAKRLATFQKAHPDIPVPDDLRAQLSDHE
jgi:Meckel syndrome type 1 protein